MQGVRNIFNIFKLDGIEKCKELISEDMVEEMLSNVYDDIPFPLETTCPLGISYDDTKDILSIPKSHLVTLWTSYI